MRQGRAIVFIRKMRQSALPAPPAWALSAFQCSLHQLFLRVLAGSIAHKGIRSKGIPLAVRAIAMCASSQWQVFTIYDGPNVQESNGCSPKVMVFGESK